jgi:hypothetical protein
MGTWGKGPWGLMVPSPTAPRVNVFHPQILLTTPKIGAPTESRVPLSRRYSEGSNRANSTRYFFFFLAFFFFAGLWAAFFFAAFFFLATVRPPNVSSSRLPIRCRAGDGLSTSKTLLDQTNSFG